MVQALGTPKRHPESGIYLFRKRVPERMRESVGRREIKFSLRTRDTAVARIRNPEEMVRLERAWSKVDGTTVDGFGHPIAHVACESACGPTTGAAVEPAADDAGSGGTVVALPMVAVPLRPIFASYAKEAELAPSTVKRWSPVVDRLVAHLGHDDAAAISRADIVAWKDALLGGGMSNITVRDVYLASIKATLQFAVDQGRLSENPAAGVKVRVRKAAQEWDKGFDGKEAETILSATLRKPSDRISVEMAAARRWCPGPAPTPALASNYPAHRQGGAIDHMRLRAARTLDRSFRQLRLANAVRRSDCFP
jgi:hypothetical protein